MNFGSGDFWVRPDPMIGAMIGSIATRILPTSSANVISQRHFALMIPIPAGCARFLCYGWIITGVVFVLGLNKNGEDLSGAGLLAIGLGVLGLYVTRPRKD